MSDIILAGSGLTKSYAAGKGIRQIACSNVDITLYQGETLGIVGESGCGKSTLLRMLTQLERPDAGRLYYRERDITELGGEALRLNRRHIQMVFQDPAAAFFSRIKAGKAIVEPLTYYQDRSLSRTELIRKQKELLALVKLPPEYADRYPHSMSGGQRQRLGIARALALDPEILICDEATAALDVSIQQQIIRLLVSIQKERDLSMIFVCHDLALVQSMCQRVMVMYLGCVVEILPAALIRQQAAHPYTRILLQSVFSLDMDRSIPIKPLAGEIPSPLERPSGCPFHTRCPECIERCRIEVPQLRRIAGDHQAACHLLS